MSVAMSCVMNNQIIARPKKKPAERILTSFIVKLPLPVEDNPSFFSRDAGGWDVAMVSICVLISKVDPVVKTTVC